MGIIIGKLKAFKLALKVWNKEFFGNLDQNISIALATLADIQKGYDDESFFEELLLQLKFDDHANLDRLLH